MRQPAVRGKTARNEGSLVALPLDMLHTLAMLAVATAIAIAVYEWIGLAVLRRAWINCDLIWTVGLVTAGGVLLVS